MLFHSPQAPHYNVELQGNIKFFNVEFDNECLDQFPFDANIFQGITSIDNPDIKFLLYKILQETGICDDRLMPAAIEMLVFEIFGKMLRSRRAEQKAIPLWVKRLKEILHDGYAEKLTLKNLSIELNVHPAHLSRDFPRYFYCTFGEYVRKIRVEKSLALLSDENLSLTEIAYRCGFADQSHFLRCFKQINKIKPSACRKLLAD